MEFTFPKPKNWQEFENVAWLLWRDAWADVNAKKNGRIGQSQAGVDVFGNPIYGTGFHGIQCKGKDENYGSVLMTSEIESEAKNARAFTPQLKHFTIATTSARDAEIQEFARAAQQNFSLPFPVSVWAWDDISLELSFRPNVAAQIYPAAYMRADADPLTIIVPRTDHIDRLRTGFTRPAVTNLMSRDLSVKLQQVLLELLDNAFRYGRATKASVGLDADGLRICDDGVCFDPTSFAVSNPASLGSGIGHEIFRQFSIEHATTLSSKWRRVAFSHDGDPNRGNELRLSFSNGWPLEIAKGNRFTATFEQMFSRPHASETAKDFLSTYRGGNIHIRLSGVPLVSALGSLLDQLLKGIDTNGMIYIYAADEGYNRSIVQMGGPRVVFVAIP